MKKFLFATAAVVAVAGFTGCDNGDSNIQGAGTVQDTTDTVDDSNYDEESEDVLDIVTLPGEIDSLVGLPFATANFTPGTFTAEAHGFNAETPVVVSVSFTEDQITNVEIISHGESTYGNSSWFNRAIGVPDQILVRQSTQDIDAFTGASMTRGAIIEAVEDAIVQAGANPTDLEPQTITQPLEGDRFVPGMHTVTVPTRTHEITLADGETAYMLFSEDTDMIVTVAFSRNEFNVHYGGGQNPRMIHGESAYPGEIRGGTMGGWWFRQMVHLQANDQQSTHNVDVYTGATLSASGVVFAIEEAMRLAGADPANITPLVGIYQNDSQAGPHPENPSFRAGHHTAVVESFGGPLEVIVTTDRGTIRRIQATHNDTESFWDTAWPELRDDILEANSTDVDIISGATVSSEAIIEAVTIALDSARLN